VLLLQRPPTLTSLADAPLARGDSTASAVDNLSAVSCLTWFAKPHRHVAGQEPVIWKPDFVELKLRNWIERPMADTEPSSLITYHMGHINLHVNIGFLQRHSRSLSRNDYRASKSSIKTSMWERVSGQSHETATWHSHSLLKLVRSMAETRFLLPHHPDSVANQHTPSNRSFPQPPHLPFCVYFASLVLWYGAMCTAKPLNQQNIHLRNGAQLLESLSVHVAKYLARALYELAQIPEDC
jgi:hypothetical protein